MGWNLTSILGIDPGSQVLGYGLITEKNGEFRSLDHGVIKQTAKSPFSERLLVIGQRLGQIMDQHCPEVLAIEDIFLGKNVQSAFKLGHVRGVILYEAQKRGMEIFEWSPRSVKKGITGKGNATKEQVELLVKRFLNLEKINLTINSSDASDALAVALYQARRLEIDRRLKKVGVPL